MSSVTKYLVFGPNETLKRLAPKLLEDFTPKYHYIYKSSSHSDQVAVAVYEEYEKRLNATITLTVVIESTDHKLRIELKRAGGRMGFRGSSLSEDRSVDTEITDFIMDYSKRYGLSLQEVPDEPKKEDVE
jgi:hypothetical protein